LIEDTWAVMMQPNRKKTEPETKPAGPSILTRQKREQKRAKRMKEEVKR